MKRFLSTKYSDNSFAFGIFILRLAAGGLLIPHGFDKLQHFGKYSTHFISFFSLSPSFWLGLVIFSELFCATLVVLGLFTRLAALVPVISFSVAVIKAHKGDIFGQAELPTLFLAMYIVLLFVGAGKFSMDRLIGR